MSVVRGESPVAVEGPCESSARVSLGRVEIRPEFVSFVEVPGILLIRLMSRCNEKCTFCMVADEIDLSDDVDFDVAIARIAAQPPDTQIEFFGGEPTIYPRFLELLRFARQRGHPCSIASNGRAFHSKKFTDAVAALDPTRIYVRMTFLGHTEAVHDGYAQAPESFRQTIEGVRRLVAAGFTCQINVVMLPDNIEHLEDITNLVADLGVPRIKFGSLVGIAAYPELVVPLAEIRPRLRGAIALAEKRGLVVTVEKTPVCATGSRIDLFSTERKLAPWPRSYDDNGACGGCLVRPWCDGLDPDYAKQFGFEGIERISRVPPTIFKDVSSHDVEMLKVYCVCLDEDAVDQQVIDSISQLAERVEAVHGELAVFPSRYVLPSPSGVAPQCSQHQ